MINEQKEIWISTGNKSTRYYAIIAVSNCGRIMRKNGKIEIASRLQFVFVGEKRSRMIIYRFLANNFIKKTEDDILKQRTSIDHITHTPTNMHINDVRNLRWCTQKENCNFKEAKLNKSKAQIGKNHSEEVRAKISAAQIGKKLSEEAKAKMSKNSKSGTQEVRAKMSAAKKGRLWYNNGVRSLCTYECPIGFVPGRIYKRKEV